MGREAVDVDLRKKGRCHWTQSQLAQDEVINFELTECFASPDDCSDVPSSASCTLALLKPRLRPNNRCLEPDACISPVARSGCETECRRPIGVLNVNGFITQYGRPENQNKQSAHDPLQFKRSLHRLVLYELSHACRRNRRLRDAGRSRNLHIRRASRPIRASFGRSTRHKLRVTNLLELVVVVAASVAFDNSRQELGGRDAACASGWQEFALRFTVCV